MCVLYYACSRVSDIKNYAGNLSQSIQPYLYTCKCLSHNTNKITSTGHPMELYPGNPYHKHWNVTLYMQFVCRLNCFSDLWFKVLSFCVIYLETNSVPFVITVIILSFRWYNTCDKTSLHGCNFVCRHFYEWPYRHSFF